MVQVTFSNPVYLWFLLSLPILIFIHSFSLQRTKTRALKFANFEAISRVTGGQFIKKNIFLLVFRFLILLLIVLAVSGTTATYVGTSTSANYVLALDSSASMLVQDIQPSRLSAAKETLSSFLDFIPKRTKLGLVTFSGVVLIENTLDSDLVKLKNSIDKIEVSQIGGTDIGNAIVTSANILLAEKNSLSNIIILITDGQSNVGIPLEDAIDYANKNNIIVDTIGIGTEEGGQFIGTDVVSRLDEEGLKAIAENTEGKYFKAESKETLIQSFSEIAKLSRKKISVNLSFTFIFLSLIFLLIEWALINTKNKIIP